MNTKVVNSYKLKIEIVNLKSYLNQILYAHGQKNYDIITLNK